MAWAETTGGINDAAGLMFAASVVWIVAYDTMYAMVDREDDIQIGIKSTAVLFGDLDRVMVGLLQAIAITALALLGIKLGYQHAYFVAIGICALLFSYQQYLIRRREAAGCFQAFKNNIWVGFVMFAGTVVELTLRAPAS